MELAGGFRKGDRVAVNGALGTVLGPPARLVAAKLSVTIGYDDGTTADVRAANLVLADEAAQAGYSSAEPQQPYGIGNRMLDDRYASQPLGGEIEAGYGIGNRRLDFADDEPAPGSYAGYGGMGDELPVPQEASYDDGCAQQMADPSNFDDRYNERYAERPLPDEGYGTQNFEDDSTLMPPASGPPAEPITDDELNGALASMDDALFECESGLNAVQKEAESGNIQSSRTMLAQLEARAKSIEGALDGVPTNQLPADDPRKNFKRELLQRLDQFFAYVDYLFKQLTPSPQQQPPPSAQSRPSSGMRSTARTAGLDVEPLAGDFQKGDRVVVAGEMGTVLGRPARAAAARLSVSVHFDAGHVSDVRVANIQVAS
mmetsp:Transcript_1854/g.4688  ORF Transcript_1854/g.4688 Transcript_1854/m.4688 type:complete len:373 (+) Transcript_1854:84-1202(+)